jgi:hypothetical protein
MSPTIAPKKAALEPSKAIGYKGKYQTKTGSDGVYLKIILKEALPAGTELIGFPAKDKKQDTHPDFHFQLSKAKRSSNSSDPFSDM